MPTIKEIDIKNYVTHHVRDLPDGHEIIIVSGDLHKEKLLKLKCHWKNRKREKFFKLYFFKWINNRLKWDVILEKKLKMMGLAAYAEFYSEDKVALESLIEKL